MWKNLVAEGVEKVAETLDEFRGRWKYNMLDDNLRAFNASVPTFFQWDDHEVINNWSASKDLSSRRALQGRSRSPLLAARAGRAFHEMTPIRYLPEEPGRVYRKVSYGPLLDIFFLDLRCYRGPNGPALETEMTPQSRILGEDADALAQARACRFARDLESHRLRHADRHHRVGQCEGQKRRRGDRQWRSGRAQGPRARIRRSPALHQDRRIANIVWLTADVHYTAANYYDPDKAQFQDFTPFWEFVSGPSMPALSAPAIST